MTMLKIQSAKKNEKGIALIFTLIMLSLLMILALSFALDSMFEQKAAYNSASSSSSGFMGQSQLKQVLLLMENSQAHFDSDNRLYSHDFGTTTDTDMLKERLPYLTVLLSTDKSLDPIVKVNWNYIRSGPNATDPIIGRTAFVVIPEDKIPLDSLVDERVALSTSCVYPKHNEKDNTETRIGKYVSEINVRAAIPTVATNINIATETLNWQGVTVGSPVPTPTLGFDNGKYTGRWLSFSSLFGTLKTAGADLTAAEKEKFEEKLTLDVVKDAEAFWAEAATGGDKTIGTSELYKRFDLTRTDWDTANNAADVDFIKNKILLDSDADGAPDLGMEKWADTDSDSDTNSKGLPWLACFGYKTDGIVDTTDATIAGTFGINAAAVAARRYQIAANLKDYCDTDSRPTSDVDPGTWSTLPSAVGYVHPTYTGNEKTPYINKVGMKISISQDESGSGPYSVWANVVISPSIELINVYDSSFGDPLMVKIEGSITMRIQVAGVATTASKTQDFNCSINVNPWEWVGGHSLFKMDSSIGPFETAAQSVTGGSKKVDFEVTQINFTKVVLVDGTNGYDYTKNLVGNYASPVLIELNNGAGYRHLWYGFAAHDPRQNLNGTTMPSGSTDPNDAEWLVLTPLETTNPADVLSIDASGYGAPNSANTSNGAGGDNTQAPSDGVDLETGVADPANSSLSTAYIRNAPMESPWELGFIHRGAKWETINMKKYDTSKAFQLATGQINGNDYIPGGGAYTAGDANILDQVKMTAKAKSPQKINLCSKADATFDALFSKIKLKPTIGSTMSVSSMAGGSDAEMLAGVSTIISNVKAKFLTPDTTTDTNLTRASVVDQLLLPLGTTITATTDADQEELIGKIVNLTKVGGQSGNFTIIVLSQTIKDIGIANPGEVDVWKTPADGSTALKVPCQLGRFDVTSGGDNATWRDDAYGDEITGEQKIMVKGSVGVDGAITITSFQYIE